ncbi:MAG: HIT family protein [Phycisphaeraceae bacterium]
MADTALHDPSCIFCRIVAGQIPAYKLYEDEQVLSFLDVGPLSEGHALVIPKAHYQTIDQMPEDLAAACMRPVPRLSRAVCEAVGVKTFNVLQNNGKLAHQAVDHVHIHIIPKTENAGLGVIWPSQELAEEKARDLQQRIAAAL